MFELCDAGVNHSSYVAVIINTSADFVHGTDLSRTRWGRFLHMCTVPPRGADLSEGEFFMRHRLVTDGQTDGRTHDDSIYRASIESRGKNPAPFPAKNIFKSFPKQGLPTNRPHWEGDTPRRCICPSDHALQSSGSVYNCAIHVAAYTAVVDCTHGVQSSLRV